MNNRYLSLNKAPFTPPSYVFGIVWPILYTLMGISTYLIWSDPKCSPYCSALTFFFIQLFFNLIWTTLFFKWNMYKTALLDIVVMFGFSVVTFLKYLVINPIAAYLLIPYLAWLCLAFTLNAYIVAYN